MTTYTDICKHDETYYKRAEDGKSIHGFRGYFVRNNLLSALVTTVCHQSLSSISFKQKFNFLDTHNVGTSE